MELQEQFQQAEAAPVVATSVDLVTRANGLGRIITDAQLTDAQGLFKSVVAVIAEIHDTFDSLVEKAHALHKDAIAKRAKHLDPCEQAKKLLSASMGAFQLERQRAAEAERKRREQEAREAAEIERKRIEDERAAEAAALESAGATEAAELVLQAGIAEGQQVVEQAQMTVIAPPVPTVDGLSFRTVWKFEVETPSLVPDNFWVIDDKAIGAVVRTQKERTVIPGVRIWSEQIAANKQER